MGISLRTHKILWGRSGGKCAICKNELLIDPTTSKDVESIVGDEAHIIARKESFNLLSAGSIFSQSESISDRRGNQGRLAVHLGGFKLGLFRGRHCGVLQERMATHGMGLNHVTLIVDRDIDSD